MMHEDAGLQRESRFAYHCRACCRCCHDRRIQLNPYEVARLAHAVGISCGQFIERHMEADVAHLKFSPDGACEFLAREGCTVHADRPLVCRLYPLGRHLSGEGQEWFSITSPHPESQGELGTQGTVAGFIQQQGAGPYLEAADRYLALFYRLWALLLGRLQMSPEQAERTTLAERLAWHEPQRMLAHWLDMDRALANYCQSEGLAEPAALEARMALHLKALEHWIHGLEQEEWDDEQSGPRQEEAGTKPG